MSHIADWTLIETADAIADRKVSAIEGAAAATKTASPVANEMKRMPVISAGKRQCQDSEKSVYPHWPNSIQQQAPVCVAAVAPGAQSKSP